MDNGINEGRDGEREVLPAAIRLFLVNDKMANSYNTMGLNTQVIIGACFFKMPNTCVSKFLEDTFSAHKTPGA